MTTEARVAAVHRVTSESDVEVKLNLDGTGESVISTGVSSVRGRARIALAMDWRAE